MGGNPGLISFKGPRPVPVVIQGQSMILSENVTELVRENQWRATSFRKIRKKICVTSKKPS